MKTWTNVQALKESYLQSGTVTETKGYYDGWAAYLEPQGAATYQIVTSATFGATPDEYGDHTIANGNIAVLISARLNADQHGVRFNGTETTAAMQNFVDKVVSNTTTGHLQKGTVLISSKLNISTVAAGVAGFGFKGDGRFTTVIKQNTDNTPIFDLGVDGTNVLHSYFFEDMGFDYTNTQTGNTSASCLYFSAQDNFYVGLNRVKFSGGYWGIKVKSGVGGPWGCDWDALEWGSGVVGGAMDWSGAANAVPNNNWGRFGVDCKNMTEGTIFKEIKGYNNHVGTIEIFGGNTNLRLISFQAGSEFVIGSIKCETITYNGTIAGNAMITVPTNGYLQVGSISIGGTVCTLTPSTSTYVFAGASGNVDVGFINVVPSAATSNMYLNGGSGRVEFGTVKRDATNTIPFTNLGGTAAADSTYIRSISNDMLSADKGDADYTVTLGDPTNIRFETALTAIRTVTLPGADGDLVNGMRYRVISEGAINGANTINIDSDGATRATLTVDDTFVELMYRRFPTGGSGWKVIGRGTI